MARLLGVLYDVVGDSLDQRMREPLVHRTVAPAEIGSLRGTPGPQPIGHRQQALGGVGPAIEDEVLDPLAQVGGKVVE